MSAGRPRRVARLLTSPRLATALLALVGAWAAVAGALGAHRTFASPTFLMLVALLAVCTAACAWERTRVAAKRAGMLRGRAPQSGDAPADRADLEIACDPELGAEEVLESARDALARLGIRARRAGDGIAAGSPAWTVWGSPVFHWALVVMIVAIPLGGLLRSSGQIGLAVGQTALDAPSSYGILSEGPLHDWSRIQRSVRVDAFDVSYETGGVDRGPTPTVSVLDAEGRVIKSQRVYPNNTLKTGSLTVYPYDYGLSASLSISDDSGSGSQQVTQLIDFSGKADDGTVSVLPVVVEDSAGDVSYEVLVSVPLDEAAGGYVARLPATPVARVMVMRAEGDVVLDEALRIGERVTLPTGEVIELLGLGYYARLQLVDDPSLPFVYAAAVLAILGLAVATLAKQMMLSAAIAETAEGRTLRVRMRLWRVLSTSRAEIEAELRRSVGLAEGRGPS